ncbi:hypothetical protein J2W79_000600 [Methylorubrum extorquens]|nr:hypothetical protein [Methylorubrum extorquens]
MEGAPAPVPRMAFVYSADEVFKLVRDKFWRDHASGQPQIKMPGLYNDAVKSQKPHDDHFRGVLVVEFNRWWSNLGDDEKIQVARLVVNEKLKLGFDLQIPDDISNAICRMNAS